jgi:hypothetical protein
MAGLSYDRIGVYALKNGRFARLSMAGVSAAYTAKKSITQGFQVTWKWDAYRRQCTVVHSV